MKFSAITDWAATGEYGIRFMCKQLSVFRSEYYTWLGSVPSDRHSETLIRWAMTALMARRLAPSGRRPWT